MNFGSGNVNNNNKNNNNYVLVVRDFILSLCLSAFRWAGTFCRCNMEVTIEEVFEAYYECRKHKRNKEGALAFEVNLEENLVELYNELKDGTWQPEHSFVFIVKKPVPREIFAASFRDRIVHHLIIRRLNPYLEKYFIYDSYACRENKGTHAAISRVEHFIRSSSCNGSKNSFVLKIDIQSFFMSINRIKLYKMLEEFINKIYCPAVKNNAEFEKQICKKIIFNETTKYAVMRCSAAEWNILPKNKSLFNAKENCGLPIGNLTSQVFANFYLSLFDHYVKHELKVEKYVRYVDDCVITSESKSYLKNLVPKMRKFLEENLFLTLHPKKIYLQPCNCGVQFLGCYIKPNYTVCSHRVAANFKSMLIKQKELVQKRKIVKSEKLFFRASVNSYLGIMCHYKTYKLRIKLLGVLMSSFWKKYFCIKIDARKVIASNL